ncbi:hypothetical protein [Legionella tunisiensis]|uniref:hypothetical protein n=1 Tax=Legionella tunisiensis TaxID=1034944 RepID=UPI0002DE0FFF|nr:hypothetical protein [Legionella tunisiensis]
MSRYLRYWILLVGLFPTLLFAGNEADHLDPVAPVILWVTLILFFAILGRYIARRFNQPGVLGELLMGVFLGNLCYFLAYSLLSCYVKDQLFLTSCGKC